MSEFGTKWISSVYSMNQAYLTCQSKVFEKIKISATLKKNQYLVDKYVCLDYLSSNQIITLLNKRLNFVFETSLSQLTDEMAKDNNTIQMLDKYLSKPKFYHLSDKHGLVKKRLMQNRIKRIPASIIE